MSTSKESPLWKLRGKPDLPAELRSKLVADFERFAETGLPANLENYLLDEYRINVSTHLADYPLKNPFGKASGQLSMTARQVQEDAQNGLGFVILKTVIAQDETGQQMMHEWAIQESRMVAEPIVGQRSGREGWTISWKGRGWWHSFDDYLNLVREGAAIGREHDMLVVPSCKYHLPMTDDEPWKVSEYEYTTLRMEEAWQQSWPGTPMPLEKDFSPTLAGSDRARQKERILQWMAEVPRLVRQSAKLPLRLGLKLFNAVFEDEFQIQLLRAIAGSQGPSRPDFLTYANRLFDPHRKFDDKIGIAFGGPDLSDRNLAVLDAYLSTVGAEAPFGGLPVSATGDIHSGRLAMEYALRGCSTFQIHTFFQLPASEYVMKRGSKVERALHKLYFDPEEGLLAWLTHLGKVYGLHRPGGELFFSDAIGLGRTS